MYCTMLGTRIIRGSYTRYTEPRTVSVSAYSYQGKTLRVFPCSYVCSAVQFFCSRQRGSVYELVLMYIVQYLHVATVDTVLVRPAFIPVACVQASNLEIESNPKRRRRL